MYIPKMATKRAGDVLMGHQLPAVFEASKENG